MAASAQSRQSTFQIPIIISYLLPYVLRLGSWQFMADMPYSCVSMTMMWKLVWLMHHGCKNKVVEIDQNMTMEQCVYDLDGKGEFR